MTHIQSLRKFHYARAESYSDGYQWRSRAVDGCRERCKANGESRAGPTLLRLGARIPMMPPCQAGRLDISTNASDRHPLTDRGCYSADNVRAFRILAIFPSGARADNSA
jgi:hypothetical protein